MRDPRRLLVWFVVACAVCVLGWMPGGAPAAATAASAPMAEEVRLIFHDGRVVEGSFIGESATSITVHVTVAGISAEATYEKSDLLEIERGIETGATGATGADVDEVEKPATAGAAKADLARPGATSVYLLELRGGLGREVSVPPLKSVLRDIKRHQPDMLLIKIDMVFRNPYQQEARAWEHYFFQFAQCLEIVPIFTDDIRMDKSWKKKPKLVFWVKNAMGGSAFLPFNSPHVYYTSDAKQGGVGYLDKIYGDMGDMVVREKLRSAWLGMAEGMAVRGGHNPVIIRAMARSDYTLSYDMVGGKPVYHENSSDGQWMLTDDGSELNADSMQDMVRGRGNDVLRLDADKAFRLRISDGTVDTIEDLMHLEGVARNYTLIENKSKRILDDWARGVSDSELNFRRLFRDFVAIQVQGDYQERTAARGRQIRILRQMLAILDRYGKAINPYEIGGYAEQFDQTLNIIIQRIKNLQQLDGPP